MIATGRGLPWGRVTIACMLFFVGLLVGGEYCAKEQPPPTDSRAPLVCAPCPACDAARIELKPKKVTKRKTKSLPAADPAPLPNARKRLLAWARTHSVELVPCRTGHDAAQVLGVSLRVNAEGAVNRVRVQKADATVSRESLACVRRILRTWKFPTEWTRDGEELVFSLTF